MPRRVRVHSLSSANTTGAVARASSSGVWRDRRTSSSGGSGIAAHRSRSVNGRPVRQRLLDRPAQHGVLERGQVAAEHAGDELGGEALAGDDRVVAVAAGRGPSG